MKIMDNKKNDHAIACKLPSEQFRERKATVLANLKKNILDKKELDNGYALKFTGTDTMLDELIDFIKTERECCSFLTFSLTVSNNKSETWLELTGPEGTKDFIKTI